MWLNRIDGQLACVKYPDVKHQVIPKCARSNNDDDDDDDDKQKGKTKHN